jgi:hypothetical protein
MNRLRDIGRFRPRIEGLFPPEGRIYPPMVATQSSSLSASIHGHESAEISPLTPSRSPASTV